jgi:hypothetical protein
MLNNTNRVTPIPPAFPSPSTNNNKFNQKNKKNGVKVHNQQSDTEPSQYRPFSEVLDNCIADYGDDDKPKTL